MGEKIATEDIYSCVSSVSFTYSKAHQADLLLKMCFPPGWVFFPRPLLGTSMSRLGKGLWPFASVVVRTRTRGVLPSMGRMAFGLTDCRQADRGTG